MAYIKTYTFNFVSTAGIRYTLEFYDNGSTNSSYANLEGKLGKGACSIKYGSNGSKIYSPLKPSTLNVDFMVTDIKSALYIKELKTNRQERDVYVYLYKAFGQNYTKQANNPPIFAGYLLFDLSDDPDVSIPFPVKLKAIDGLASLKYYDFIPESTTQNVNHIYDKHRTFMPHPNNSGFTPAVFRTFTKWISLILVYSGYATTSKGCETDARIIIASNWYNAKMNNTTENPLDKTSAKPYPFYEQEGDIDSFKYKAMNCYDALNAICATWGMRCFAYKNKFYFIAINLFETDESGSVNSPINIKNWEYQIDGTYIGVNEALDYDYEGRYNVPVALTEINKKLAGSQYGLLPALKKVEVEFHSISNYSHFSGFPKIPDPFPSAAGPQTVKEYEDIGTFNFDGTTDRTFYTEIWLDFLNQDTLGGEIIFTPRWTVEAKKDGTSTWYMIQWATPFPYTSSWVTSAGNTTFWGGGLITLPQGASTHNLTDYGFIGNAAINQFISCPASQFTQGNWRFRYKTEMSYASVATDIEGHGRSVPNPNPMGTAANDPISRNVSYTVTPFNSGVGTSVFVPIENASIGNALSVTTLHQSGNDTEVETIKDVLFGDTYNSLDPTCLQVYDANTSSWVDTDYSGEWGLDTSSGTLSFSELLATEVMQRQAKNVKKLNTQIVMDLDYWDNGTIKISAPFTRWFTPSDYGSATLSALWIMHTGDFFPKFDTWNLKLVEFKNFTVTTTTTNQEYGGSTTGGVGSGGFEDIPDDVLSPQAKLANPARGLRAAIEKLNRNRVLPLAIVNTSQVLSSPDSSQAITSIGVQAMPTAILKSGDKILVHCQSNDPDNIYANTGAIDSGSIEFEVNANQEADATSISVVSKTINRALLVGDQITISQPDLFKQYNHKTRGTVGGFTVDDDGLSKGGIEITGWLDSDIMEGTSANSVPTSESVKTYVDTQVASIPKGLVYQGTWNASTNDPTIESGSGTDGYYWIVSVEGTTTIDGISDWKVGDWIIFSSNDVYQKIDQSEGDTLQTVTDRGDTTTNPIFINPDTAGSALEWKESDSDTVAGRIRSYANRGEIYLYKDGVLKAQYCPDDSSFVQKLAIGKESSATNQLDVDGNMHLTGSFFDSNTEAGSSGQVLSSTGAATDWISLDKNSVGLGEVDNTSDADKPISNATQTALDLKATNAALNTTNTNVTTNTNNITANDSDISTNAGDIATNSAAITTKAPLDNPTFTTKVTTPILATPKIENATDIEIDTDGDIILDAKDNEIILKDDGTSIATFDLSSQNLSIKNNVNDKNITIQTLDSEGSIGGSINVIASGIVVGGDISVSGSVDGRNIANDGTQIDTNEADIATNAANITTNANGIAANLTGLGNKVGKGGSTMTGNLILDDGAGDADSPKVKWVGNDADGSTTYNGQILVTKTGEWQFRYGGNTRFLINTDGDCKVEKDLIVDEDIVVTGTVDGVDIAALNTTVDGKQNTITLTTTGTEGAATFNSGTGALNIPQYSGGTTSVKSVQLGCSETQVISSGGNVGSKTSYTEVLFDTAIGGVAVTSPYEIRTGGGIKISENGTYMINFSIATTVSGTANRTLAGAMLYKEDSDGTTTTLTGTQIFNYDRGTETSSGGASWGSVYKGSGSGSYLLKITEIGTAGITYMEIFAGFWIEGRASSSSGVTTEKDGCILNIMQLRVG